MSRQWVKLYCKEWLDKSIRQETPATRDVFTALMSLAGIGLAANTGSVELIGGTPYSLAQLAQIINITQPELEIALKALVDRGRITMDGGIITITNWHKYQSEYERTKQYRQKGVPKVQPREEGEGNKNNTFGELVEAYEANIGMLTPMIAEDLKDLEREYKAEWVKDAIKEAVTHNARNIAYIKKILETWKTKGRGKPKQAATPQRQRVIVNE